MKIIRIIDPNTDVDISRFNDHNATVMVYMMEGCPHCVALKPKWEQVKERMANDKRFDNTLIADIDSSASQMHSLPPVTQFPTIRVLRKNKIHEYMGERDVDPLLSYIKKMVVTPKSSARRKNSTARRKNSTTRRKNSTTRRKSNTARRKSNTARRKIKTI